MMAGLGRWWASGGVEKPPGRTRGDVEPGRSAATGGTRGEGGPGAMAGRWRGRLAPRLDTGKGWAGWISSQAGHGAMAGRWRV